MYVCMHDRVSNACRVSSMMRMLGVGAGPEIRTEISEIEIWVGRTRGREEGSMKKLEIRRRVVGCDDFAFAFGLVFGFGIRLDVGIDVAAVM